MQFKSYKKVLKSINQKMEIAKLSPIYDKRTNLSPRLELNYNILQTFRKLFVLNPSIFKQTSSITRLRVSIGAQAICGVIINFVASLISNKGLLQQNGSFSKTSKPAPA